MAANGTGSIEVDNNVFINRFDGAGMILELCILSNLQIVYSTIMLQSEDGGVSF